MALVICSNIRDDIIYQRNADYDAAYSFHNSLKQTLKIDPDSEVAVQSVKLSKSSNIIVKESDQWFQFFGKDLHKSGTTADDGPYYPIQCNPSMPVGFPSKSVNMEDFAALIKKGMNIGMPMPSAYGRQDFKIERDANGAYKGFTTTSDYLLTKGQNFSKENTGNGALNAAGSWECTYANETPKVTVTEGAGVGPIFTQGAGDIDFAEGGVMIKNATAYPLSNLGGVCEFDVTNMATATTGDGHQYQIDFQVGLCRAFSRDGTSSGNGHADNGWVPYYNPALTTGMGGGGSNFESHYYDVVVSCEQVAGAGNRKLKVHQSVADGVGGVCLKEVEYFFAGGTHTNRIDLSQKKTGGNGVDLRKIKFTLSNEILKISFIDGGNAEKIICDYATDLAKGAVKKNLLAPIAQTRWNLYPKLCMIGSHNGKNMQLSNFDAHPNTFNSWSLYNPDNNWYVRNEHRGLTGVLNGLDIRYMYDYDVSPDVVPTYIPLGLDSKDNFYLGDQAIQFIFAPSTLTYQHTEDANMAITLGFEQSPVLAPSINGTASATLPKVSYTSDGEPSLMTTASLFVRLDNFTQLSYNAGVGRPSKILYHLPRFDTSNREIGNGLYFEPTERTYVKLNNSETLYANEMSISIANDNEQLATDLVGKTIVVLHFRKSSNVVSLSK